MRHTVQFIFRGEVREISGFSPTRTLLDWLREEMLAKGTKEGCNEGDCGACTVVLVRLEGETLRYDAVNACIMLLGQVDGAEVLTVEDLSSGGVLHPVQRAMVDYHGAQCGFCTPGIVMSLFAAYHGRRPMGREDVADCLAGNLCRCTGYRPIFDAAADFLAKEPEDAFHQEAVFRLERLKALNTAQDLVCGDAERFFAAPATLSSALAMLAAHPQARVVAGATDVGLWVTKKLSDLPQVIYLGRVGELQNVIERDEAIFMGAMVTHTRALPILTQLEPDLGVLMRRFASQQVRNSGTVGGNIANGSPIGDLPPALIALGAQVHLRQGENERVLPLEDFFIDYGKQDRAPGELVTGISIPKSGIANSGADTHFRCFKISKRFDEDISTLLGAFAITLNGRSIGGARIAFGGMAGTPKRAAACEAALIGASIDNPADWGAAIIGLAQDYQPISDMRASSQYRARVARALLGKALIEISGAEAQTRIVARAAG